MAEAGRLEPFDAQGEAGVVRERSARRARTWWPNCVGHGDARPGGNDGARGAETKLLADAGEDPVMGRRRRLSHAMLKGVIVRVKHGMSRVEVVSASCSSCACGRSWQLACQG